MAKVILATVGAAATTSNRRAPLTLVSPHGGQVRGVQTDKVAKFRFRLKTSNGTPTVRRDSVCLPRRC